MPKINFGVLITVSLKSKRLRKKAILDLGNQTIIENIIDRMIKICPKKRIVLIISNKKIDFPLRKIAEKKKIKFFSGSAIDVLDRMSKAVKKFKIKNFVSTTGDNPFVDYYYAKKMIAYHLKNKFDFTEISGLSWGAFSYGVNSEALEKIVKNKKKKDTEVWGNYFRNNNSINSGIYKLKDKKNFHKKLRLTIDYKEDYIFAKEILKLSKNNIPLSKEIIDIINKNKKLLNINKNMKQKKIPIKYY